MGKQSTPSHVTQTNKAEPWIGQQPYLKDIFARAKAGFEDVSGKPLFPDHSSIAPMNPWRIAGQEMKLGAANQMAGQIAPVQEASAGMLNPLSNPLLQAYSTGIPASMGFLQSTMAQQPDQQISPELGGTLSQMMSATPNMEVWGPLMQGITDTAIRGFKEEVLPALRTQAMGVGQYGSGSRPEQASGLAAGRLAESIMGAQQRMAQQAASEALQQRTMGAQLGLGAAGLQEQARAARIGEGLSAAGLIGQGVSDLFGTGTRAQIGALGLAPQTLGLGLMPGSIYSQVGAEREAHEQALLNEELQRYGAERNAPFSDLAGYAGLVSGNYGGVTTSQIPYFPSSPIMGALGGGMLGYGMAPLLGPALQGMTGAAISPAMFGGMGALLGLLSSKAFKEGGEEVDVDEILDGIASLDIEKWKYKGSEDAHIGPYAEDFRKLFGVGDGVTINIIDAIGVLMASVKALQKRVAQLEGET